jgi:exosortase
LWKQGISTVLGRRFASCSIGAMSQITESEVAAATMEAARVTPALEGRRVYFLAAWVAASVALFWAPLRSVIAYAAENDDASHIFIIPILAVGVLYLDRERVFRRVSFDVLSGSVLAAFGAVIGVLTWRRQIGEGTNEQLSLYMLALVILWIAGFALFFGRSASYEGKFALLFLFLSVPLPDFILSRAIYWLQAGSASVVAVLFDAVDLPYLRSGFIFHTAHINIEIAQECSGIRSSMAVLILALLAAHFYLRSGWKQAVFVACSLFVMIIKNGVRIAVLTILAIHVDPSFLFGRLHHDGGVVFFLLGLGLLVPVLWLLARGDKNILSAPALADQGN